MSVTSPPGRLLTISYSHYCDKARWALERFSIPFIEETHVPTFHAFATLPSGANRSVPALILPDRILKDSSDILRYADEQAGRDQLYPTEPAAAAACVELVARFDSELGPHSRRLLYFYLLQDRALTLRIFRTARTEPAWERWLVGPLFPLTRAIMRRAMRIDAEGAQRSRVVVDQIFAEVSALLSDGRRYLVGDRFSAADLTFAALAVPMVMPAEYGFPLPPLTDIPAPCQALIEKLRQTPAGAFARRMYATERRRVVPGRA